MKVLVMFCHPIAASFNAQVARAVCASVAAPEHELWFHDLYREEFGPVLAENEYRSKYSLDSGVQDYMDQVVEADVMVFVHPDWWGQVPALLKGWLDRVFRPGIAYDYVGEEFLPKHRELPLAGKKAIAYCTTDAGEDGMAHPLLSIWEESIFRFCGINGVCRMFYSTWKSDSTRRRAWLSRISTDIGTLLADDAQDLPLNPG
jgi:NAD(P)H dehydrogenase (quinone)